MSFFRDLGNFFNRERKWALLFLFLLTIYGANLFAPHKIQEPGPNILEELRQAETQLKEEIQEAGGIQPYLSQSPGLMLAVNFFSIFILAILIWGLFLDGFWVFRRDWRERIRADGLSDPVSIWGLTAVFKVIAVFITLSIASGFLLTFLRTRFFTEASPNLLPLIHTTFSDFLIIGLVVYFIRRQGGHWRELGFKKILFWEDLKTGAAGYAAILPPFLLVLISVALAASIFTYEPPPHPLVEIFLEEEKRGPLLIAYSIFLACVAGPVLEEVFFRGFCYPALKKRWGTGWGLVLSAAFFAGIHQSLFAFLPITVLGLGLGYLYEKRGTLLPSIALHIIHNGVFIAYFFLAKRLLTVGE